MLKSHSFRFRKQQAFFAAMGNWSFFFDEKSGGLGGEQFFFRFKVFLPPMEFIYLSTLTAGCLTWGRMISEDAISSLFERIKSVYICLFLFFDNVFFLGKCFLFLY